MAITSAFQADDAGSIPAARSSFKTKSPLLRVGFLFFIRLICLSHLSCALFDVTLTVSQLLRQIAET